MKVSYKWLQEYIQEKLPPVEEVVNALTMHAFEVEGVEEKNGDFLLDVKVLPNRSHDCLSHYGIASEIASILGLNRNFLLPVQPLPKTDKIKISINTKSTDRQLMVLIEDLNVGESPKWLKEKLNILGHKSINSVVDITNYLMFSFGQPMHAFDADKIELRGGNFEINMREAKDGEQITLLNGNEYKLKPDMMVIADSEKALDVAGIMGGKESSVTKETKNILLSLSGFDSVNIRKTSKTLGVRTDASVRFENNISSSLVDRALPYAVNLISEICGGKVVGEVDIYPNKEKEKTISVPLKKIQSMLGIVIETPTILFLLNRQKINAVKKEEVIEATPPLERLDLVIPEDIIEEIGRLHGLDKISGAPLSGEIKIEVNPEFYLTQKIRKMFTNLGFTEIYTYAFTDQGEFEIENPLASDKKFLRANLLTGMEIALSKNFKYLDLVGEEDVKHFEIGRVFIKAVESLHISFGIKYSKGKKNGEQNADQDVADAIHMLEKEFHYSVGNVSIVGGVAELDLTPVLQKLHVPDKYPDGFWDLKEEKIEYKPISPYPFAIRDVAVFVPNETPAEKVEELIKKNLNDNVVRFSIFDKFTKGDKTSYGYRLVFQSREKTLTDEEINAVMNPIYKSLKAEEGFEIR
jgi:phenylalanyl-tRNA synthetase beta chain